MGLSVEEKAEVISKHAMRAGDSGSAAVQVALITKRLDSLQDHFKMHVKDFHSQRGLMKMVSRRRRLLDYIRRTDVMAYRQLIQDLGIRK